MTNVVKISNSSPGIGRRGSLSLTIKNESNGFTTYKKYNENYNDETVTHLLDDFAERLSEFDEFADLRELEDFQSFILTLEGSREKIIEGFRQLRENGNSFESMEIVLEPKEPEPHFSCKNNKNEDTADGTPKESEISQSELQQKLAAIVEKDNKVIKFFEENKCSVCLGSYKEI